MQINTNQPTNQPSDSECGFTELWFLYDSHVVLKQYVDSISNIPVLLFIHS